eukprot:1196119-Prorocentrum_minimum.AAC.1
MCHALWQRGGHHARVAFATRRPMRAGPGGAERGAGVRGGRPHVPVGAEPVHLLERQVHINLQGRGTSARARQQSGSVAEFWFNETRSTVVLTVADMLGGVHLGGKGLVGIMGYGGMGRGIRKATVMVYGSIHIGHA